MTGSGEPIETASAEARAAHERAAPLAIVEASGDPRDPVIAGWSEGAALLFGYAAAEVVGRSLVDTLAGRGGRDAIRRLVEAEGGASLRCEGARKDGSEITVAWVRHRLGDEPGRPARAIYVGQAVTTHVEAEAELREARSVLRAILDSLPITACRYDREGVFTFHDGKGMEAIGVKPGQFLGRSVFDVFASSAKKGSAVREALAGRAAHDVSDMHGVTWETWLVPSRDERGELDGAISITLNAADAKRKELELRAKLELIDKQQKVIRDLQTPIIEVWDKVLTLPMVGVVDSLRLSEVMDNLLQAIVNKDARFAILDLTGVDVVDTQTAGHLIEMIQAIRLLGAEGIITGIRSNVAQTMISLGIDLSTVTTVGNLRAALKLCMRRMAVAAAAGEAGAAPAK